MRHKNRTAILIPLCSFYFVVFFFCDPVCLTFCLLIYSVWMISLLLFPFFPVVFGFVRINLFLSCLKMFCSYYLLFVGLFLLTHFNVSWWISRPRHRWWYEAAGDVTFPPIKTKTFSEQNILYLFLFFIIFYLFCFVLFYYFFYSVVAWLVSILFDLMIFFISFSRWFMWN